MGQAFGVGASGIGVVAWLLTLAAVSMWIAQHPHLRHHVAHIGDARLTHVARQFISVNFGASTSALRARIGLAGAAGLVLLSGPIAVILLAVGFTALLDDVPEGDGVAQIDDPAEQWMAAHRDPLFSKALLTVTRKGDPIPQTVWIVLVCLLAAYRATSWLPILLGVAGGGGIVVVLVTAKTLVGLLRRALPFALTPTHGFSFPSGHATGAAAVGLLCAWLLSTWVVRSCPVQVAVWAVTVAIIGLIGFSRPYLGVHFGTEVLAGWLLGAAWAGAVILVASWWTGARSHRREYPASYGNPNPNSYRHHESMEAPQRCPT